MASIYRNCGEAIPLGITLQQIQRDRATMIVDVVLHHWVVDCLLRQRVFGLSDNANLEQPDLEPQSRNPDPVGPSHHELIPLCQHY